MKRRMMEMFYEGKCSVCGAKLHWDISEVNGKLYVIKDFEYCPICQERVCDNPECMDAHLRAVHNIRRGRDEVRDMRKTT